MKKAHILSLFLALGVLFMFYLTSRAIYFGAFPFWFDPARDLGLGLANLKKLSLIGHPSGGLSGVFYGPYYIWLISLAEAINKDPRWVWFAFAALPYFTLFPFMLSKFRKYSDIPTLLAFWLLFLLSFSYYIQVWNPNPTPIMYLAAVYFATLVLFRTGRAFLFAFLTGIMAGLIANFHMSFGAALIVSFFLAFAADFFLQLGNKTKEKLSLLKNKALQFILYGAGVFVTYIPFLLFESRHGFNQIKIILANFVLGLTKGASLNIGAGIPKPEVAGVFFGQGGKLMHLPGIMLIALIVASFAFVLVRSKNRKKAFSPDEIRLMALVLLNALVVLFVFVTTKNPVYEYFFTGVEMFFLLFALIVFRKIPALRYLFIAFVLVVFLERANTEVAAMNKKSTLPNYATKREAVDTIYRDNPPRQFTVFVYDPAIYTYDFDYIFNMYGEKYGFLPDRTKPGDRVSYVVLPATKDTGALTSFTDYYTPSKEFITKKKWTMTDGTVILRRERAN